MKNQSTMSYAGCLATAGFLLLTLNLTGCNQSKKSESAQGGDSTQTMASDSATSMGTGSPNDLKPKGAKPAWAPSITPQMQVVLEKLASYQAKPLPQLPPKEARMNPTPTMAVMAVMKDYYIPMPEPKVDTSGQQIPVGEGKTIHARVYTPKTGNAPFPVIVYYHGGGWVIADLDTYNASAQDWLNR